MSIVLGPIQYGKAETRVVRIVRDTARHEITDLNVSSALRGPFGPALPRGRPVERAADRHAEAQRVRVGEEGATDPIEGYGLALAHHFVDDVEPVEGARIEIERYDWTRVEIDGTPHDHTFVRTGQEVRTAAVTLEPGATHVVQGFKDLIVLKSTGSHFKDFLVDEYTTLQPTDDRIMATSLTAQWRVTDPAADLDWNAMYAGVKAAMIEQFATLDSFALQQTLWHMGRAALEAYPEIAEIRLVAPNKHHFVYDFSRFDEDEPERGLQRGRPPLRPDPGLRGPGGRGPRGRRLAPYTGMV